MDVARKKVLVLCTFSSPSKDLSMTPKNILGDEEICRSRSVCISVEKTKPRPEMQRAVGHGEFVVDGP